MNKTFVRAMGLVLALFIIAGLIIPAFAVSDYQIGSDTKGVDIISGEIDTSKDRFDKTGKYKFEVVFEDSVLKLKVMRPGKYIFETTRVGQIVFGNKIFESVWGLSLQKPGNEVEWKEGDTFHISIVDSNNNAYQDAIVEQVKLTNRNGGSVSRIYKGGYINANFVITDPNATHASVDESSVRVLYESDAFVRTGDADTAIAKKAENDASGKATFEVSLKELKYSGKGNGIRFLVLYTADGKDHTAVVNYTVPDVKEDTSSGNNDDDDDDDKEIDPLTPYIIVESYTYGGTNVTAGNEFNLRVVLRNTSSVNGLQNIKMSVSPKGVFSMTSSSNTFYIDSLTAGGTIEKEITLYAGLTSVTDEKDANSIGIDFDFQFVANDVRKSGTSTENITIPVFFPDRFEYTEPSYPSEVYIGEEFPIYIPVVNKGRSTVYNLSAELVGVKATQEQKIYLGNINAGSENSVEFYIAPEQAGELEGHVLLTYEDANMNLIEKMVPFNTTVQEPFIPEMPDMVIPDGELPVMGEGEEKTSNKNLLLGASFVIMTVMSCYITVEKLKRKRSEFDDETV